MSGNKIETIHDTVLKVRLVFFDIVHELPYEGPCRFGKGMELERQFDEMINNEAYKGIQMGIKFNLPEGVEIVNGMNHCKGITTVKLPSTVTAIYPGSLDNLENCQKIHLHILNFPMYHNKIHILDYFYTVLHTYTTFCR